MPSKIFKVDCYEKEEPMTRGQILAQLNFCTNMVKSEDNAVAPKVGILTTEQRGKWANIRKQLKNSDKIDNL
jgi:hypothetical protein